jgi:hypothetical protein
MSATDDLINDLLDPWLTRDDIAADYAAVMRYVTDPDWTAINLAILQRYKPSGLAYIKAKAWKINAEFAAAAEVPHAR